MVEKFTGFKASNGRAFDDERSAWKEELYILLHPLADNDAIARKLTEKIADAPHDIQKVLTMIVALSPVAQDPIPVGTTMEATAGYVIETCSHGTPVNLHCEKCPKAEPYDPLGLGDYESHSPVIGSIA